VLRVLMVIRAVIISGRRGIAKLNQSKYQDAATFASKI